MIAEEVAKLYSDLVVNGPDGRAETVQYDKLTPMILNELQKLHRDTELRLTQQDDAIRRQQDSTDSLAVRIAALEALMKSRVTALERKEQ